MVKLGLFVETTKEGWLHELPQRFLLVLPWMPKPLHSEKPSLLRLTLCYQLSVFSESDCMDVAEACRGNLVRKEIENIIEDIQRLKEQFTSVGFVWIKREGNDVADLIAKLAASNSLPITGLSLLLLPLRLFWRLIAFLVPFRVRWLVRGIDPLYFSFLFSVSGWVYFIVLYFCFWAWVVTWFRL